MPRFNFDLIGSRVVHDHRGMLFEDCKAAARFAEELATELGVARPELHGKASVVMTDERHDALTYCVAVG
jgi:hypothetical protein